MTRTASKGALAPYKSQTWLQQVTINQKKATELWVLHLVSAKRWVLCTFSVPICQLPTSVRAKAPLAGPGAPQVLGGTDCNLTTLRSLLPHLPTLPLLHREGGSSAGHNSISLSNDQQRVMDHRGVAADAPLPTFCCCCGCKEVPQEARWSKAQAGARFAPHYFQQESFRITHKCLFYPDRGSSPEDPGLCLLGNSTHWWSCTSVCRRRHIVSISQGGDRGAFT